MASWYESTQLPADMAVDATGVAIAAPTNATTPVIVDAAIVGDQLECIWTDDAAADTVKYTIQAWDPTVGTNGTEFDAPAVTTTLVKALKKGARWVCVWKA